MITVYTAWFRFWALALSIVHPKTILRTIMAFFIGVARCWSASIRFVNASSKSELLAANPVKHHDEVVMRRWAVLAGLATYAVLWLVLIAGTGRIGRAFAAFKIPVATSGIGWWAFLAFMLFHTVLFISIGRTDALMVKVQTARIAGESLIRSIVDEITLSATHRKEGYSSTITSPPAVLHSGKGYEVTVRVHGKGDPDMLIAGAKTFAHKLQKDRATVFTSRVKGTDLVRILVLRHDPWSQPPTSNPLVLNPRRIDLWTSDVEFGLRADYTTYMKRLVEEGDGGGIIVAGKPRAGKSVYLSNLLVALMLDPTVGIHIVDGSAVDYAMVERACTTYVGEEDMEDEDLLREAHELVKSLKDEANRRKKILKGESVSKLSQKLAQKYNIGTEWLLIDEMAVITEDLMATHKKDVEEFISDLQWLIRMGPKYGIFCVLATQRPSDKSLPTTLRGLIPYRVAFYIADQAGSYAITGKSGPEWRADRLDPDQKGVAIIIPEGQVRIHLVETFDLSRVCSYAMSMRQSAPAGVCDTDEMADYPEPVRTMLQIMDELGVDVIPTEVLISELISLGHVRVTERNLAESLKPFDISPERFYDSSRTRKRGYKRKALELVPKTVYTVSRNVPRTDQDSGRTDSGDSNPTD